MPIDVPPLEPALVVYAFPSPDSAWTARVGRTQGLSGFEDVRVEDALVVVFEDGAPVDTLALVEAEFPDGPSWPGAQPLAVYRSAGGLRPRVGPTYRLEVSAPGLPLATAEVRLPDPPEAEVVAVGEVEPGPYGARRTVRIALEDPEGEDVYELSVTERVRYESYPTSPEGTVPFSSLSPSFRESCDLLDVDIAVDDGGGYFSGVVFRDRLFDGRRQTFELKHELRSGLPSQEADYSVLLIRVSEAFAEHEIRRAQQEINVGNPFAEPSPLYSNVEGGHGVVGGFTAVRLPLPPPPQDLASGASR